MVVEAAYVGNRGAWWTAPLLSATELQRHHATAIAIEIRAQRQKSRPTQQLLLTPISSPSVIARFPNLANPNSVYPGFPVR